MPTTNKGLNQPALNSTSWNTPLNDNFGYIDAALGGVTTINTTGIGTTPVSLTLTEYQNLILNVTGPLTANVTYQMPSGVGGEWIVSNNTTGAFTLTIRNAAAGAQVVIPTGGRRTVYSDGTNVYFADSAVNTVGAAGNIAYSDGSGLTGSATLTYASGVLKSAVDDAINTGVTASLRAAHTTSGTAGVGIGAGVVFSTELPAGGEAIGAGIYAVLTTATAGAENYELQFRVMAGGAAPTTIATITTTQILLGTDAVITARGTTNTAVQSLAYAGITATADADGTFSSGTYTPTPVGGNFKTITNAGAFTISAPSASGDYTLVICITNSATAGAITMSGFEYVGGDSFTTASGNKFFVFITKLNGFQSAVVQALQ